LASARALLSLEASALNERPPEAFWKARRRKKKEAAKDAAPVARQMARINPAR
jgi:hypothetical protein